MKLDATIDYDESSPSAVRWQRLAGESVGTNRLCICTDLRDGSHTTHKFK